MKDKESFRVETDSMGDVKVPGGAYWGAQTQRAVENFSVSDLRIPVPLVRALGLVKQVAAIVNGELGLLEPRIAEAVGRAAAEMAEGKWDAHFPIDVFQTGSGTSWNMNANEVIANRANELLGSPLGAKKPVHPNDHVNRGQSSNDVIPTVINIADRIQLDRCASALDALRQSLARKAAEFANVLKIGRTHLQDAVPMTLGQEFSGYTRQVEKARELLLRCAPGLEELAIGGTAIGTGINTHPDFARARHRGHRETHPSAVSKRCELVRGHCCQGFAGGAGGRAQLHFRLPDQDRQRPSPAFKRSADRSG